MRLLNALEFGVDHDMPVEARRQVVFSNAVYLVVGGLLLAFSIVRFNQFIRPGSENFFRFVPIIIVALSVICLSLNYVRYFLFSKVLFATTWILLVIILPVVLLGPGPSAYFQHPYFGILFSPVVHLLFSFKREKFFYLFFVAVFFLLAIFSLDFLLMFDRAESPKVPLVASTVGFRVNLIIFWLFLNLLMIYVLRINSRLYDELESKNKLIKTQHAVLDTQKVKLGEQNKVLEEKVEERTRTLKEQNEKLKEYAFMHAHVLRAPISRIRGLINLLGLSKDLNEHAKIKELIAESMTELDDAALSMSEKLNDSNQ